MHRFKSSRIKTKVKSKPKFVISIIFLIFLISAIFLIFKFNTFKVKSLVTSMIFPSKSKIEIVKKPAVANLIISQFLENPPDSTIDGTIKDYEASSSSFFTIDEDGVILSKELNQNLPSIISGEKITGQSVKETFKILNQIKTFNIDIKEIKIYRVSILSVRSSNNLIIIFDLNKNIDLQLAALQLLLEQAKMNNENMESINLHFEQPVVKYASQKLIK